MGKDRFNRKLVDWHWLLIIFCGQCQFFVGYNMRMWMVNPSWMCRQHLLGEHVELHMFLTHLRKGRGIDGYLRKNCLEPLSIYKRHEQLALEMLSRGMNHKSPLDDSFPFIKNLKKYYKLSEIEYKVDVEWSTKELLSRCKICQKRYLDLGGFK
jgi:hypothetical protein